MTFAAAVLAYAIAAVAHCVMRRRAGYSASFPHCRVLLGAWAVYELAG